MRDQFIMPLIWIIDFFLLLNREYGYEASPFHVGPSHSFMHFFVDFH